MSLVFSNKVVRRLGIFAFAVNSTRRAAKENRVRPRPVEAVLTSEEKSQLTKTEQQFLITARQAERARQLKLYADLDDFDKNVELQLANRAGANSDPKLDEVLDVRFRPTDNDAFIRNAIMNANSFESKQAFSESDLFNDQDRNIGLFSKTPTQATITIQAFVSGSKPLVATNEFVLSSVSEASQEKYQIFQTFDDDFIYFFDRNPHIYTYGGLLVNAAEIGSESAGSLSATFEWKNRFQALYEKALRGTKCVENNARAILTYENVLREGFLLNFSMSEDAMNPLSIPFSFTFFVTKEVNNHRGLDQGQQELPADFIGVGTAFSSSEGLS